MIRWLKNQRHNGLVPTRLRSEALHVRFAVHLWARAHHTHRRAHTLLNDAAPLAPASQPRTEEEWRTCRLRLSRFASSCKCSQRMPRSVNARQVYTYTRAHLSTRIDTYPSRVKAGFSASASSPPPLKLSKARGPAAMPLPAPACVTEPQSSPTHRNGCRWEGSVLASSTMQARSRKEHCKGRILISALPQCMLFSQLPEKKTKLLEADLSFPSSWRCRTRSAPSVGPVPAPLPL